MSKVSYSYSVDEIEVMTAVLNLSLPGSFIPQTPHNVKVPHPEWRNRKFTADEVKANFPFPCSVIPGDLGFVVVDVDDKKSAEYDSFKRQYAPDALLSSRSGLHFFYRVSDQFLDDHPSNYKLSFGDWRARNGVLVLWHPDSDFLETLRVLDSIPVKDQMMTKFLDNYRKLPASLASVSVPVGSALVLESSKIERGQGTAHNELVQRIVTACYSGDKELIKKQISIARASNIPQLEIDQAVSWAKKNVSDRLFKGVKNSKMLARALTVIGVEIMFCSRFHVPLFRSKSSDQWERYSENRMALLREKIQENCSWLDNKNNNKGLWYTQAEWDNAILALQEQTQRDRLRDWLESLSPGDTAITPENWLSELFGVGDDAYCRYAQSMILYGIVLRTKWPAAMIKSHTVLVGSSGIGKSALVSYLLPEHLRDFALEGMDMSKVDLQEFSYLLKGKAIIELSEMRGANKAESGAIKTLLNLKNLEVRPKYGRQTESIPMQNVFVGTANTSAFLPSEEVASLRFMPIKCSYGAHVEAFLDKYRDSLFKQAWDFVEDPLLLARVPPDVSNIHLESAREFQSYDPRLLEYYDTLCSTVVDRKSGFERDDWRGGFTHAELAQMAWPGGSGPRHLITFHNLLLENGWTALRPNKKKSKVWYAPEDL